MTEVLRTLELCSTETDVIERLQAIETDDEKTESTIQCWTEIATEWRAVGERR